MEINSGKDVFLHTIKIFADVIFEISREEIIVDVWAKNIDRQKELGIYKGKDLNGIRNDAIISITIENIRKAFQDGRSASLQYTTMTDTGVVKMNIKIFPPQFGSVNAFSVLEYLSFSDSSDIVEDKWKLAMDAAGDGMWDVNMRTNKIFFSPKWHEIFGYAADEVITNQQWSSKIHPEDLQKALSNYQEYLQGRVPMYKAEIRYLCKDGTYKWILSRGIVISYAGDGTPERFIGTHTDIHSEKLNEQALRESEKKYRVLFDFSDAMICTHDLDGILLSINPFISRTLGYEQQDLIGLPLSAIIPEVYRDQFQKTYLTEIKANGKAEGVFQIFDKNGNKRFLLYKNHLFSESEGRRYVIGFAQDITRRIEAEEALKSSVDTFSSAFRYSGIGIALVSPDGKWMDVNEALCHITEYTKEELLQLSFQSITHPDDVEKDLRLVKKMLDKQIDNYSLEKRYISKNGRIIWVALTVSLVWNADGTPKFFIAQIMDITAQKLLSDAIHRKNSELEAAKDSLVHKVNQLEELSYIIAHNLRGPVNNIKLLSEVLRAKFDDTPPSEEAAIMSEVISAEEAVSFISEAGTALKDSLESLLAVAQIRLNKDIPFDDCDVSKIIEDISIQLQGNILETHAHIHKDLSVKHIEYPRVYLESILYNLLSNAIKYRRPGIHPEITISTYQHNGKTALSVKDNGLGIDLDKYGQKVFRLNQVFHEGYDSKGVGLFLVKTQVESLGGTIHINSVVDSGTEFIVIL